MNESLEKLSNSYTNETIIGRKEETISKISKVNYFYLNWNQANTSEVYLGRDKL